MNLSKLTRTLCITFLLIINPLTGFAKEKKSSDPVQQLEQTMAFKKVFNVENFRAGIQKVDKNALDTKVKTHIENIEGNIEYRRYSSLIYKLENLEVDNPANIDFQLLLKFKSLAEFQLGEYEEAAAGFTEFLQMYPRDKDVQEIQYFLGLSQFYQRGSWLGRVFVGGSHLRDTAFLETAFGTFKQVLNRHPNSPYRNDILAKMTVIKNILSKSVLHEAEYDFNHKAFLGSLDRCGEILREYPGTQSEVKALALMKRNYLKLGLQAEADELDGIVKLNHHKFT